MKEGNSTCIMSSDNDTAAGNPGLYDAHPARLTCNAGLFAGDERMLKLIVAVMLVTAGAACAATVDFTCEPTEVAVFQNRIHVKCAQSYNDGGATIWYWAVSVSGVQWANRFLSTSTTALVSGRKLVIQFTAGDTSGTRFGCLAQDCRRALVITIR